MRSLDSGLVSSKDYSKFPVKAVCDAPVVTHKVVDNWFLAALSRTRLGRCPRHFPINVDLGNLTFYYFQYLLGPAA